MNRKQVTERRRRVLEMITLGGLSRKEAAKNVGLTVATVDNWLHPGSPFRADYDAWKKGPPLDDPTVAQARRILVDELARRIMLDRSKLSLRDFLGLHDRFMRVTKPNTEKNDDRYDDPDRGPELGAEDIERMWAKIQREAQSPEADPADKPEGA